MFSPLIEHQRELVGMLRKNAFEELEGIARAAISGIPADELQKMSKITIALVNVLHIEEEQLHEMIVNASATVLEVEIEGMIERDFLDTQPGKTVEAA